MKPLTIQVLSTHGIVLQEYNHVPLSSLVYGTNNNFIKFQDEKGKFHFVFGAIVIADEETSTEN